MLEIIGTILMIFFIVTGIMSLVTGIKVFLKKTEKEKFKKHLILFGISFVMLSVASVFSPQEETVKKEVVNKEVKIEKKEISKKEMIKIQKLKEKKEKEEAEIRIKEEKIKKELEAKQNKEKMKELKEKYNKLGYYPDFFENKIYVQVGYFKLDKHRSFTYFTDETDIKNITEFSKKLMNTEGYATNAHFFNNFEGTVSNNYSQTKANWAKGMNLIGTNNKHRFFYYESFWRADEFNKNSRVEIGKIPKENGDIESFRIE